MKKLNKKHTSNNNKSVGKNNPICLNNVGENCVFPHSKGITLIALIITIIVMIILVGVTVNVALNGGLFDAAQKAAEDTEYQADYETLQAGVVGAMASESGITNQRLIDNLPDDWKVEGEGPFTVTSPKGNEFTVKKDGTIIGGEEETATLPEGWTETTKPTEWDNDKIIAVTDGTNIVPLPEGYEISSVEGEHTIEEGVVITDGANEFVWIPISTDFTATYSGASAYSEPTELTGTYSSSGAPYDSQITLDYLYGEGYYDYPETEEEKANVENNFAYKAHYEEMIESINKYNGFYIGRYETTIAENNEIGSIGDTAVLTADKTIPQTNNKACRWYGLYYTQRNSNVTGNNDYVQTNMIWGQQWDKMLEYFDSKSIDYVAFGKTSQGAVVNSGQSTNGSNENDKIYNIYDLRTNGYDWTAEAYSTFNRSPRGGSYSISSSASSRSSSHPTISSSSFSSRLTLYIK